MLYTAVRAALVVGLSAALPLNQDFESYKRQFSKTYATVEAESAALAAYTSNDAIIRTTNAKGLSYWLGHNEFSDQTWEEFQSNHMSELFLNRAPKNMRMVHLKDRAPADAVDWVAQGAVTPVKNQGRCGSCWAFSTTGSIEGAYQIASKASGGSLTSLSEEDLVQCDDNGDQGCNGGLMDNAFEWVEKNGLCTEDSYPYTSGQGVTGTCVKKCKPAVTVTGFADVAKNDEDALKSAVAQGPVSIAIEADKSAFQLYKGGILDSSECGTKLDHGVLIVGYGTEDKDYWKIKNSWGASWGEDGYIRMVRGKNMCGLAMQASYPKGAKVAPPSPPGPGPSPGPSPPSPSPPGPPAGKTHYGDPKNGCMSDEVSISIQGTSGDFCTPQCKLFKPCPKDMPAGVTAKPQCALQDASTGNKYCALICSPSLPIVDQKAADDQCGTNASCKGLQAGVGVCTYDD